MDADRPPGRPVTLALQWTVVAVAAAVMIACMIGTALAHPHEFVHGRPTPFGCMSAIVAALAHALWITLDCRRRGAEVGAWRFAAILCGPIGIWLYLIVTYRVRALLYIPLSLAIYSVLLGVQVACLLLLRSQSGAE